MMDSFYIFEYKLSPIPITYQPEFCPLSSIKYTIINPNNPQLNEYANIENISQFTRLDEDITEQKVLFKKMLQHVVISINESMDNFRNVTLVSDDIRLFTEVIPKECQRRGLSIPYTMMNFIDIRQIVRLEYRCPCKRIEEIADFLEIFTVKEAEEKMKTQTLERILKKINNDNKLKSTSGKFIKKHQKQQNSVSSQNLQQYKYYKIIGLPFKSFPAEILQILAPQVHQNLKDICFIYDRQRFSGRGIIKIPPDYEKFLIPKNRMYIGQRYIELQLSTEQQFQKAKLRSQQGPSRSPIRTNYQQKNQNERQNSRDVYKIGRRRSHSRSPPSRERSRQGRSGFREKEQFRSIPEKKSFDQPYVSSEEFGIKVRGLPFAFSQWDVENVFNYHNIIGGSVKLGLKPGTMLKNGEAVILMRSYNDAQKSLQMNGFRCMGRYLEVRVINKDQYMKYK